MPFEFHKTALSFQSFIDQVIRGLDFVYAYINARRITVTPTDFHELPEDQNFDPGFEEITVNPSLRFECPPLFPSDGKNHGDISAV